jgi:DNA-binding PadR family transcriptional regulator
VTRKDRRLSDHAAHVLHLLLERPEATFYGLELIRQAGIPSGSLYPILRRFEERELIVGAWEDLEAAAAEHRRPRRFYMLNPASAGRARAALSEWETHRRRPGKRPLRPETA